MKYSHALTLLIPFILHTEATAQLLAPEPRLQNAPAGMVSIRITPAEDKAETATAAFRKEARTAFASRDFTKLDEMAEKARKNKELTGAGSWRIVQFYSAIECAKQSPENVWRNHDATLHQWIAAKPESITARTAYADFLASYAWQARGTGYANTVTQRGWELMGERLAAAKLILENLRILPDSDPYSSLVMQRIALGQGWPKEDFDSLMAYSHKSEPKFWGYDAARAYSLLPRWHGAEGDWEKYADECVARPGGLGAESYARIVIWIQSYYRNIFQESKASWPATKKGLEQMMSAYPESLSTVHEAVQLAQLADDREFAKKLFEKIGTGYLPQVWKDPMRFHLTKTWAEAAN